MSDRAFSKWRLGVILILVLSAAGFYWALARVGQLNQSMFGTPNARSASMEPYEMSFKTFIKDGCRARIDGRPYEWRLTVPRAYVVHEIGSQTAVKDGTGGTNASYFVFMRLVRSEATGQFEPASTYSGPSQDVRSITVNIANSQALQRITDGGRCMQEEAYRKLEASELGFGAGKTCLPSLPNCRILSHYNGWDVRLTVPQADPLYLDPQKTCDAVNAFLDKHTTHIDSLLP